MDECISRKAAIKALSAEALERNLDSVMTIGWEYRIAQILKIAIEHISIHNPVLPHG